MEYYKQFHNHVSSNDFPSLISLWQEYCLSDEIEGDELHAILLDVKASPLAPSFGKYAADILPLWSTLKSHKHECLRLIFDLQTTNTQDLADFAYTYLEERYKDDPSFAQKIKLVGLRDKKHFPSVIANFELLAHMNKGNFFLHNGGWGIGEVIDVSLLREQITLEFDNVSGYKEISFANAFKTLTPVSADHFLARRFGDPDAFEAFARENPTETIRILLRDLGPKSAQEIKDELCDLVIPERDWAKWWQMARSKLKKDTMIASPEALKDPFILRTKEVSHEERLLKTLAKPIDTPTLIEEVYAFLRDFPQTLKNGPFTESIRSHLTTLLKEELSSAEELQILFLLQDLGHPTSLDDLLKTYTPDLLNHITILSHKKRFLMELKRVRPDWVSLFAESLLIVDQNPLRDYILEELLQAGHKDLVQETILRLTRHPETAPTAILWYFQKILDGKEVPLSHQEGLNLFLETFFVLLHKLEPVSKEMVKKMHTFLTAGRFAHVRQVFQKADLETIKEVLLLSTKCITLSDHELKILYSLAEVVHPSLSSLRKEEAEDHVVWTTEEGYLKIKERIEQIATVETVENAREIEVARSHGDLRENSEYKFALEKRSRLQSELRFLSDQFKQMRVLTKNDISTDTVHVGTVVTLSDAAGKTTTYTLLGPWDADPEKQILSFQSKIAKDLIGLKPGDSCRIQDHDWHITSIKSFL